MQRLNNILGSNNDNQQSESQLELDFPNLPIAVMGDKERFMQVLVRLTKNALKYSAQKSVTVRVAYEIDSQLLCGQVKDEGKGLTQE